MARSKPGAPQHPRPDTRPRLVRLGAYAAVMRYARGQMEDFEWRVFLADNPRYHAPEWHEFGVKGHMWSVCAAASRLCQETGRNIEGMAALHDVGKVLVFSKAVFAVEAGRDPSPVYRAHEAISARLAGRRFRLSEQACRVIANHQRAYDGTPAEKTLDELEGSEPADWILLCAADNIGKGHTPAQDAQRLAVIDKLATVARLSGSKAAAAVSQKAIAAIRSWRFVPRR